MPEGRRDAESPRLRRIATILTQLPHAGTTSTQGSHTRKGSGARVAVDARYRHAPRDAAAP